MSECNDYTEPVWIPAIVAHTRAHVEGAKSSSSGELTDCAELPLGKRVMVRKAHQLEVAVFQGNLRRYGCQSTMFFIVDDGVSGTLYFACEHDVKTD
jgi:hypothetical protein